MPSLDLEEYHCLDCRAWCGRCTKGKTAKIAADSSGEEFTPKPKENTRELEIQHVRDCGTVLSSTLQPS